MNIQISIIGLGWLGLPLANSLRLSGFKIKGSTTSNEKLELLKAENYDAYKVVFSEEEVFGEIEDCLKGSEILILNTPPGLRRNPDGNYVQRIKNLIPYIEKSSVKKILFIGSTSVFQEAESFPVITNEVKPNSISNSGIQLQQVENLLLDNANFETTILRFAGLVDDRRHPARMMSKRKAIPNPQAPINLIHLKDCVGVINAIIVQEKWGEFYNAAYPLHPTKEEYYSKVCLAKNLSKPDFSYQNLSMGKIIDGNETAKTLNYNYNYSITND